MKKQYIILILSALGLLISCDNSRESVDDQSIDVASAMSGIREIKASEYFKQIRYVALETSDSCLVGRNPSIYLFDDKILISSREECFLFDKQSGRFIRKIGHTGNDPKAYRNAECWVNESDGLIYFTGFKAELICYNTDGMFIDRIPLPANGDGFTMLDYTCLNKDTLMGFYHNLTGNEKKRLVFFTKTGERIDELPNRQESPSFDIESISVFNNGEVAAASYTPAVAKGMLILSGRDPETVSTTFMKYAFWHLNRTTYFKEACNDTIFRIEGTTLIPDRYLDLGEYHWSYAKRFDKKQDKNIFITQCLENEDILLFRFITKLYDEDSRKQYNAVYNKANQTLTIGDLTKGITDDITRFLPLQPLYASSETGEFAGIIPADKVVEWFEGNKQTEALPESIRLLKNTTEEDNPVIVLMN
jgi:hypothetical protein